LAPELPDRLRAICLRVDSLHLGDESLHAILQLFDCLLLLNYLEPRLKHLLQQLFLFFVDEFHFRVLFFDDPIAAFQVLLDLVELSSLPRHDNFQLRELVTSRLMLTEEEGQRARHLLVCDFNAFWADASFGEALLAQKRRQQG
jgi:hypothetical protein